MVYTTLILVIYNNIYIYIDITFQRICETNGLAHDLIVTISSHFPGGSMHSMDLGIWKPCLEKMLLMETTGLGLWKW